MRLRRNRKCHRRLRACGCRALQVLFIWRLHVRGVNRTWTSEVRSTVHVEAASKPVQQRYTWRRQVMATGVIPKQLSIQDFISELHKFPEKAFVPTSEILAFLERTSVAPESLAPYLTWDRQHYTRNLIDKTPLYELIAICWEVGQASSVHNHRDQNCWMAVPIGRLLVQNYRIVFQQMEEGRCELETADTLEMNPAQPCAVDLH